MHGRPAQRPTSHLRLPLVKRRELLVVLVKVLEELLEDAGDLFVDPGSVAELDDEVERVDHREVLKADLIVLEVEEDVADHAHDLLLVREIQNLCDVLDHVQTEVLEQVQRESVVAQDPEACADVVGDLSVLLTVLLEYLHQDVEAAVLDELLGELVDFEHVHQTVRVGLAR